MEEDTGSNADAVKCDFGRGVALFGEFRVVNSPGRKAQARLDSHFDEVGAEFAVGMLTVDSKREGIVPQAKRLCLSTMFFVAIMGQKFGSIVLATNSIFHRIFDTANVMMGCEVATCHAGVRAD